MIQRTYTRVGSDTEDVVWVNVDENGYIRMRADNLHQLLQHLGYTETTKDHE